MPLKFEEPEHEEEKPKRTPVKKEAPSSSQSEKDKKKKGTHRRVFTHSSYYFADVTITVIDAKLNGKKSASPFCRLYLGSHIFNTATKKKTITPNWNETFTSKVDRDDWLQIRIYDQTKLEKQLESGDVQPMGKKKLPIKDLAREDSGNETLQLAGGGEINISYQIKINQPKVGTIHTKFFNYPTWMNDKYGVNVQQPDFENQKTAVSTITRYAMRWLRNQKAIANLVDQENDDDVDDKATKAEEIPEGVEFKLLDMSFSCHDKALQLLVTYKWDSKDKSQSDEDLGISQILQMKVFHMESKTTKKKLNNIKPMTPETYQKEFKSATGGLDDLFNDVHTWMEEKGDEIGLIFKLAPISTYNSYHVILWYYR